MYFFDHAVVKIKCSTFFTLFFLAFFLGYSETATVFRFANIYGDHMVLQQAPRRARIWGFGEVGQRVSLTVAWNVYCSGIQQGMMNS